LDSFYILDQGGLMIYSKNFKPENKDDIIKEFYFEYNKRRETIEDYYPILDIKNNYCAYIAISDLIYVATFTNDMPILLVYSIIHHIISLMKSVYETFLYAEKLRENLFSIIPMIDHFMDYGYPLLNDNFTHQALLKRPTVMEEVAKAIKTNSVSKNNPIEKYIESMTDIREENWHVVDVKTDNELLFDVVEYLDCVIDKEGQIIQYEVHGEVKVEAKIPSPVDICVFFTVPQSLKDFSIHPCLMTAFDSFEREKVLNFKCPQGGVQLMNYNIDVSQARVPFDIIPTVKFTSDELFIELQVRSTMIRGTAYKTDDFNAKIFMPKGLIHKESKVGKGAIRINDKQNSVLWKIGECQNMEVLKLNLIYGLNNLTKEDVPNIIVCVKFQVQPYTYSGTKIDKAVFKDPDCKYAKKARCVAKSGYYEIRLN